MIQLPFSVLFIIQHFFETFAKRLITSLSKVEIHEWIKFWIFKFFENQQKNNFLSLHYCCFRLLLDGLFKNIRNNLNGNQNQGILRSRKVKWFFYCEHYCFSWISKSIFEIYKYKWLIEFVLYLQSTRYENYTNICIKNIFIYLILV